MDAGGLGEETEHGGPDPSPTPLRQIVPQRGPPELLRTPLISTCPFAILDLTDEPDQRLRGSRIMGQKLRAFTLGELVAVTGLLSIILSLSISSLARFRELNKRLVCSVNLKGIGAAAKTYADQNNGTWMIPPFDRSKIDNGGIDYRNDGYSMSDTWPWLDDEGEVGWDRASQSESDSPADPQGTTALSVTRAYWMLVRSGDVYREQFICPSSFDVVDDTGDATLYYDFKNYTNISYGYQVPFGPRDTRPREDRDNRQVLAADKGPFYTAATAASQGDWETPEGELLTPDHPSKEWRLYNSNNHGSWLNGEGQNCLFPDGRVCFQSIPAVGVDNDNIYTTINDTWPYDGSNLYRGVRPHTWSLPPYPGQDAFRPGPGGYASTDTYLYP